MTGGAVQLRLTAGDVPCAGVVVNGECKTVSGGECVGRTVYAWDSGRNYPRRGSVAEDALLGFIAAHGIAPKTVVIGNEVSVRVRCDGSLWLHVWRAVSEEFPLCPHCPSCLKQEPLVVPLVAQVPPAMLAGAFVDDRAVGVLVPGGGDFLFRFGRLLGAGGRVAPAGGGDQVGMVFDSAFVVKFSGDREVSG
ncbi:hypothetical protein ABT336_24205 [Micromonospora sp. NPDC000207]|uniref:hypothetical protein n=1 Tax=Micromonospora sp. NPDC000207 TaxID=3154246 RepID=UPI003330EDDA